MCSRLCQLKVAVVAYINLCTETYSARDQNGSTDFGYERKMVRYLKLEILIGHLQDTLRVLINLSKSK